jgi:hypothetical protein
MVKGSKYDYERRVFVIRDGECSGLLIARKRETEVLPTYAYFWHTGPGGLSPTKEIKRYIGECCHRIEWSEKYKDESKIFARLRDQERIFLELKMYAEAEAASEEKRNDKRPIQFEYKKSEKGYAGVLWRFFNRTSHLRDFLVDQDIFTACVLESPYNEDILVGKAEEFGWKDPHNPFPEKELSCLRPIDIVLDVKNEDNPEEFRRKGPVFADFKDGWIYTRTDGLAELENLVLENNFSLLEGDSATGKTILALNLAYNWYVAGKRNVYYFDVAKYRYFDQGKLVRDIRAINGIIIIENIHLELEKVQWIYSEFKSDSERHFLFVTRPSYRDSKQSFSDDLTKIKKLVLKPFDEVGAIIEHFANRHDKSVYTFQIREEIVKISLNSYWLLSYALKGCNDMKGRGNPKDWIRNGVKIDLRNLERKCTKYPEILVTLALLYQDETLTSENFLIKTMNFESSVINCICEIGEVTRQETQDGEIYYGLPHTGLARAYLEHGQLYKRRLNLKNQQDFLYDYAKSGASNALKAIEASELDILNDVSRRLDESHELAKVIENAESIEDIQSWLFVLDFDTPLSDYVLRALAQKINKSDSLRVLPSFLGKVFLLKEESGRRLWDLLDVESIRRRIAETGVQRQL